MRPRTAPSLAQRARAIPPRPSARRLPARFFELSCTAPAALSFRSRSCRPRAHEPARGLRAIHTRTSRHDRSPMWRARCREFHARSERPVAPAGPAATRHHRSAPSLAVHSGSLLTAHQERLWTEASHDDPRARHPRCSRGDTRVVRLSGELDRTSGPVLALMLEETLEQNTSLTVLDLRNLRLVDPTGVHTILVADERASDRRQDFLIMPGRAAVQRVIDRVQGPFRYITSAAGPNPAPQEGSP
jgi:anti-anti-sigma factor